MSHVSLDMHLSHIDAWNRNVMLHAQYEVISYM